MHYDNIAEALSVIVRLNGDTDTNAAVYGQLAGAYYGYEAFPEEWRDELYLGEEIRISADKLAAMSSCPILQTRFEEDEN